MSLPVKLAVCMVTYNHAEYIDQAIESVVLQRTNFPFVLIIGEDCSTDSTFQKCLQWQQKFPDKIIIHRRENNIGAQANAENTYTACIQTGAEFIAILEGDDFWTDENKLAKQVALLESNPESSASFHNTKIIYSDSREKVFREFLIDKMGLSDLISEYSRFHTSSFVFRSKFFCWANWFSSIDSVDVAMFIWIAQFGDLIGTNECMSAYRIHHNGMASSQSSKTNFHKRRVILHRMIRGKIEHKFDEKFQNLIDLHMESMNVKEKNLIAKCAAFFCPRHFNLSFNVLSYRMKLDEEVVNFDLADNFLWMGNRNYRLFSNIKLFNRLVWKWVFMRCAGKLPAFIVFLRSEDVMNYISRFGATNSSAVLLFEISHEQELYYKHFFSAVSLTRFELDR